ncbi:MAG TPA: tripartite tricarboxylate transporter substrate binding protein [Burkholderiales bacterium]|nr:tripartite tricarboxylate transporter substrate binding protein [Burkholderiales bacterium]
MKMLEPGKIALAAAFACSIAPGVPIARAQDYPARTIRIILPFPPGGGTDVLARVMAVRLNEALGQSVVVDNRPGASGNIGTELTAKSPADGYTLMLTTSAVATNVTLYSRSSFDPRKDITPVTQVGSTSSVLSVHTSVPVRGAQELVALSKRTRGGLNFGSNGSGTSSHLAGVMFGHISGAALNHIPYKGAAPALNALLGGEVEVAFPGVNSVQPMLRAGKVRALAVSTRHRSAALPDLPTLDSIYPGVDIDQWFLLFVPAGTPSAIVTRLHAEIIRSLQHPEVKAFMAREGIDPVGSTPAEASAFFNREIDKFARLVKLAGVKVD